MRVAGSVRARARETEECTWGVKHIRQTSRSGACREEGGEKRTKWANNKKKQQQQQQRKKKNKNKNKNKDREPGREKKGRGEERRTGQQQQWCLA